MFRNRKFDHFKSVLHHFTALYDHYRCFQNISNFGHFSIFKNRFSPLWHKIFGFGYHFGYHTKCFSKTHVSNSFHPHLFPLTCIIAFCILVFVIFTQITSFTVYHVQARSSSRGVLTIKILVGSKSMKSGLSNAVSHVSLALLNAEISYIESQKPAPQSPLAAIITF